jgi:hypothetical protein
MPAAVCPSLLTFAATWVALSCTFEADNPCCRNGADRNPDEPLYLISIVLLLFVFPAACVAVEALWLHGATDLMLLVGKWFVFWGVGVRLFMAGVRQTLQPAYTAEQIFNITDRAALGVVREVGFGNLSMGTLGLLSLLQPVWTVPAAIVGGLHYGLAGLGHVVRGGGNFKERTAMVSDLLIFALLAVFVVSRFVGRV